MTKITCVGLISSLTFSAIIACSSNGSSDSSGGGNDNKPSGPTAVKCAEGYRLCVDQTLYEFLPLFDAATSKITEIIPPGALSKAEWEQVNLARDAKVRAETERVLRESSKYQGLRIFVDKHPRGLKYYSSRDFKMLYSFGCAKQGRLCVGQTNYTYSISEAKVLTEEIVAVAIDPATINQLLLHRTRILGRDTYEAATGLGKPLLKSGTITFGSSTHQFRIGDKLWIKTFDIDHFNLETTITYAAANRSSLILQRPDGREFQYSPEIRTLVAFSVEGCVEGVSEFCLPNLKNKKILLASPKYIDAREGEIVGVLVADVLDESQKAGTHSALVHLSDGPFEMYDIEQNQEYLFRQEGCTTDGKFCVGQSYVLKDAGASDVQTFKMLGINNFKRKIAGSIHLNDKDIVRVVSPEELAPL